MDVRDFRFRLVASAQACPSDIAVSISSLFPVVYGGLYHFNPSRQGLLYLPMLAGSLLAECGTGQAGDKCVAADLSGPLGVLIGKRNANYANSKKESDIESPTYEITTRQPAGDVQSDSTKVPEMRLVIALLGVLICIVGHLQNSFLKPSANSISRPVFCGLESESKSTFTGQILPSRAVSQPTVPKW